MNDLVMPDALAGCAAHTTERVGEQVVSEAMTAVHVVRGARQREIREPEFFIRADERPEIRLARVRPRIVFPGLVADFSRPWNHAERPAWLAGAHVERLHVPWRLLFRLRRVAHLGADHHDVAADVRTAARRIVGRPRPEPAPQIDAA